MYVSVHVYVRQKEEKKRDTERERDWNRINTFLFLLLGNICYNIIHVVRHNVALFTLKTNRQNGILVDSQNLIYQRFFSFVVLSRVPVSCSHSCL